MNREEYDQTLSEILESGRIFNVRFFVVNDDIEKKVEHTLDRLFNHFGRDGFTGVVYTCVKELMVNGMKANLKRVLFEKHKLSIDDEETYLNGMIDFRNMLTDHIDPEYVKALQAGDYWVNVRFIYNGDGVRLEVVNNAHITHIEDRRLREKLKKAMGYDNIAEFYMDQGDEMEGAGMGIALIVMLLKGMGIEASLFRIGNTTENQTFARIEIPLTENYIPLRLRENNRAGK